jgi:uncharacterized protein (TIGR02145 family)
MKKSILLLLLITINFLFSSAQNVGIGTNTPKAALDVTSTTNGLLPPRMTYAQRNAIVNPVAGLIVYCTDCDTSGQPQFFNGTKWCNMLGGSAAGIIPNNLPRVTIGNLIWSSKNLDVVKYRNGDPIPQVTDPTQWANLTTGAWCWYNNDSATYAGTYGLLYNWYAVNDSRGLAPEGWHIPSDGEWNRMTTYLDASVDTICNGCVTGTTIANQLKNTIGWDNEANGSNSSGFSALPGGYRDLSGNFNEVGTGAYWWSVSIFDATFAWFRLLGYFGNATSIRRYVDYKPAGMSVRVIRD